jgi:hypothetical protein
LCNTVDTHDLNVQITTIETVQQSIVNAVTNLFTWRDSFTTQISSTCYTYQKNQEIGLGTVKLLEDGDQLTASFSRFPDDPINGLTEQKM